MKKLFVTLSVAIMTMASFTSCDPDESRGYDLSGEWQGKFGMYYEISCRQHGYDRYYADKTYIEFLPYENTYSAGTGYQVDFYYDPDSPYDEVYHYFRWEIDRGNIYLTYRDESEWDTVIRDYSLSSSYFSGYFEYSDTKFTLSKLSDYRWNYSEDDYDVHYRPGYYHAPARDGQQAAPTQHDRGDAPRIIRFGNAMADGTMDQAAKAE